MKKLVLIILIFLSLISEQIYSQKTIPVDIVICMDLSGSTNGLIENLRERIWDIANEVNKYTPAANLRIGVVAYSRPSYGKENYYVKVIADLTNDFDFIENELFAIKTITEQGDQYVGQAINTCVKNLNWSKENEALKILFMVGNGTVNRGGNEYILACEKAVAKGIIINAVFCKMYTNLNEIMQWREIAQLGKGEYYENNINKKTFAIPTIYDTDYLRELNFLFNKTYIYYGAKGKERFKIQEDLDNKTKAINEMVFQSRLITKISKYYQENNYTWDLVDLANRQKIDYSTIDRTLLTDSLQQMNDEQLKKFVDSKWSERRQVMGTIKILSTKRMEYIKDKREELRINEGSTLSGVVIEALSKLAPARGFKIN